MFAYKNFVLITFTFRIFNAEYFGVELDLFNLL